VEDTVDAVTDLEVPAQSVVLLELPLT